MVTEVINKVTQGKDCFGTYTVLTGHEGSGGCFWCGGAFPDKRRRRFCCEACRLEYDRHFFWPVAAAWCLERASYKCHDCGIAHFLVAHHIKPLNGAPRTYNILNLPENLIALCPTCHGKRHAGMNHKKAERKPLMDIDTERVTHTRLGIDPLPGWDWFYQHQNDPYPEPTIDLSIGGKVVSLTGYKKGDIRTLMRG